jgi:hypothetical protein
MRKIKRDNPMWLAWGQQDQGLPIIVEKESMSPEENQVFSILFSNPGKRFRRGDRVTVVIGHVRIEFIP